MWVKFSVARTTILNPITEPIVGPGNIIVLDYRNDEIIRNVFSQPMEQQLKWLAKHQLIANSMACPQAACNGKAMRLIKKTASMDGFEVL